MVTSSDINKVVVVSGDADAPDGTVGCLIEVFSDHVTIEELDGGPNPDPGVYFVGIGNVRLVDEAAAA